MRMESSSARTNARLVQMQQDIERLIDGLIERRTDLQKSLVPELDIEATIEAVQTFTQAIKGGLPRADDDLAIRRQIVAYLQVEVTVVPEGNEMVAYLTCVLNSEPVAIPADASETRRGGGNRGGDFSDVVERQRHTSRREEGVRRLDVGERRGCRMRAGDEGEAGAIVEGPAVAAGV